ncbi:hypothetical protein BJ138DRAFT_1128806 [Hygrophoropsis aurantiaca]|uniref:Uncharacterized protein n=1 Tax=Hygrophoropsis aurantiaca TaxID=72124 RepID=A0ACB8A389_9AGAM|nr:hypothetical protein BJ138DRAFT_1128806 [Hygrophoropsis aurantiaca]
MNNGQQHDLQASRLPPELLELVFGELDIPSLLNCKKVCRLFCAIISKNTGLQYATELFAAGMDDGPHSSADKPVRLSALQSHQHCWDTMKWDPTAGSINMEDGNAWELCGGVLCQNISGGGVSCFQLPSQFKGIEAKRWIVPNPGFSVRDFTMDPSQDLLMLLEVNGELPEQTVIGIHLRNLSDGAPHPLANGALITHSPGMEGNFRFALQICGRRIGVLIADEALQSDSDQELLVWDWRTGQLELFIRGHELQSFSFATEDLIIVAVISSDDEELQSFSLAVLSVSQSPNTATSINDLDYICALQYPTVNVDIQSVIIRSEPAPGWVPHASLAVPFFSSLKNRLFVLTTVFDVSNNTGSNTAVLFIPLSTILSQVQAAAGPSRSVIPWSSWGPHGTRMIARRPSETWVCYSFGMKFIQMLPWVQQRRARIYDFNQYARTSTPVDGTQDGKPTWKKLAKSQKINEQMPIFQDDIITYLPGRVAEVHLPSSSTYEAVMLSEDNIVAVSSTLRRYTYLPM